jgi:hypothetical protein
MVRSVYQNGTASAPPKPLVQNPGSTSPMAIDVPKSTYDHQAQTSTSTYKKLAMTINGTQTYGWNGRPMDNDSD